MTENGSSVAYESIYEPKSDFTYMNERLKKSLAELEPWKAVLGVIAAIIGGFYAATVWVRTSAQNAVLDEKFLTTLAARVRPTCIFDSHGAIEADLGAGEYIEDIHVTPAPQVYGFDILVKVKRHLAYAPLVSGVNVDLYPQTVTRGKLHDWNILMVPQSTEERLLGAGSHLDTNSVYRFKIEILH